MDCAETDPMYPRTVADMAMDWTPLSALLLQAEPPSTIVVGAAGIGKSCAIRLCLGSSIGLWLRCSQDPTLRDNRDRIKATAQRKIEGGRINWIVLEHADALHADAQAFLRRIIETTMGSTRFVLEVRDAAAIAEPLLSRTVLFYSPRPMVYEIRGEILRRSPSLTMEKAEEIAKTCDGNIRWAVLQGLQGLQETQGLQGVQGGFLGTPRVTPTSWTELLRFMEAVQASGSSPRAYSAQSQSMWDRPGGICPWSLFALEHSRSFD